MAVGRHTHLDGYQMMGALTQLFCQIDIGRELIEIMINQYNVEHFSSWACWGSWTMNNDGRIFLRVRFHLEFIYYLVNLRGRNVATSIINIRIRRLMFFWCVSDTLQTQVPTQVKCWLLGSNHLVSLLFANEFTFHLIKVSLQLMHKLSFWSDFDKTLWDCSTYGYSMFV